MNVELMAWATKKKLPAHQKLLLVMLAARVSGGTRCCDPSHKLLAEYCGMSKSGVIRALNALTEANLLRIHRQVENGGMLANRYELLIPAAATLTDADGGGR